MTKDETLNSPAGAVPDEGEALIRRLKNVADDLRRTDFDEEHEAAWVVERAAAEVTRLTAALEDTVRELERLANRQDNTGQPQCLECWITGTGHIGSCVHHPAGGPSHE